MSGFCSVRSARVGSVVARPLASGWVWASRPLPAGGLSAGFSPAPACLFVPFDDCGCAFALGREIANYGFRVWVRAGSAGSPVFSACGLGVPAFVVKVALPDGWAFSRLRLLVASVIGAGVIVPRPVAVRALSAPLSSLAFAL